MNTVPPHVQEDKPHYVYTLSYPTDYSDSLKAGTVFYVGKGTGSRIQQHENLAKLGRGTNPHKNNLIRKVWVEGGQVVKDKIAFFETHEEACMYEIALIFFMDGLVNLTAGGDGTQGYSVPKSEEHRRNIGKAKKGQKQSATHRAKNVEHLHELSVANKGRKHSDEVRRNMSAAQKGHPVSEATRSKLSAANKGKSSWNKGKSPSEATRQKLSAARKGKPLSEATRQHLSEIRKGKPTWNKGRTLSEDHRQKVSEALMGHPGRVYTEEDRRNMSEALNRHYAKRAAESEEQA